jgi:hypothetical protein
MDQVPDDDSLHDRLCLALYQASHAMTAAYRRILQPLGLTYPQYTVLSALWHSEPRTVKEVCFAVLEATPTSERFSFSSPTADARSKSTRGRCKPTSAALPDSLKPGTTASSQIFINSPSNSARPVHDGVICSRSHNQNPPIALLIGLIPTHCVQSGSLSDKCPSFFSGKRNLVSATESLKSGGGVAP